MHEYIERVLKHVQQKNGHETEFLQAVDEVLVTLEPAIKAYPMFEEHSILERLTEPERIIMFRVPWVNDQGRIQVNKGFRVQFNSAIGPYKGGLRLHPSVNLGILKFLGFEQVFKNALTTLPMGGGKGGSDFDPKGKSDGEVMRFCQSFMLELFRHIGPDIDIPAGDIGVGGREIGYMYGMWKKLTRTPGGVLTGKSPNWGGSRMRPEATGYGTVWFVEEMLKTRGEGMKGKICSVSGSGNVAQYATQLLNEMGAKVVTLSDSSGYIHDPDGVVGEKWDFLMELKNVKRGRISEYADKFGCQYHAGKRPWEVKADIALPCATQNEVSAQEAQMLVDNGVIAIGEGANMPTGPDGIDILLKNNVLFGPAKAANAGGVATSGLEMSQNSLRLNWSWDEVREKLHNIMIEIHKTCRKYAEEFGKTNEDYPLGANIGGFMKVATSMIDQGCV